jgi:hypothetical protein
MSLKLTPTEKNFLVKHKHHALGEDYDTAMFEVERDDCFQENLKYEYKGLMKRNKELEKENNRLNELLNKNLVPNEEKEIKRDYNTKCSLLTLYRIIKYLRDNPKKTRNDIAREYSLKRDIVDEALKFLIKYKVIDIVRENTVDKYIINGRL